MHKYLTKGIIIIYNDFGVVKTDNIINPLILFSNSISSVALKKVNYVRFALKKSNKNYN